MAKIIKAFLIVWTTICALAMVSLCLGILYFLYLHALPQLNLSFLFGTSTPIGAITFNEAVYDGAWPALIGSLELTFLALIIALPIGIGTGIYLNFLKNNQARQLLITLIQLLSGMPSIVMGLFGFLLILLVRRMGFQNANTSLLLAAICIAALVLPYIVLTTYTALQRLPIQLKLSCCSLGFSRYQAILHVYLPRSKTAIQSGIALSIARAFEDVSVILLTGVATSVGLAQSIFGPFEALPFFIMTHTQEYRDDTDLAQAFAAALLLISISFTLIFFAKRHQDKNT